MNFWDTCVLLVKIFHANIYRYPRKVTKKMSKKKIQKRSKVKPFLKVILLMNDIRMMITFKIAKIRKKMNIIPGF